MKSRIDGNKVRLIGFVMVRAIAALSLLISLPVYGMAFDNIEADAAYNGPIRIKVESEFREGLRLLEKQASSLQMDVRKEDLVILAHHMYDKAILMGACVDQGVTFQKMGQKIEFEKFIPACVSTHLKFAQQLQKEIMVQNELAPAVGMDRLKVESESLEERMCLLHAEHGAEPNPPYDFLNISGYSPQEYIAMKRCHEAVRSGRK